MAVLEGVGKEEQAGRLHKVGKRCRLSILVSVKLSLCRSGCHAYNIILAGSRERLFEHFD